MCRSPTDRWRTPVDENQSRVSTVAFPSKALTGGAALPDRPKVVENIGVYAVRLSPTCAV